MKKQILTGIFILLFIGMIGTVSAIPVQDTNTGHYYELISASGITWDDARDAAASTVMGGALCSGHLATITSSDENSFVFTTYPGYALSNKWLGGFQDETNKSYPTIGWEWITGEPWVYTNWNTGEPNNGPYPAYGGPEGALTYWSNTGKWNDAPHLYTLYGDGGYLIEWDCLQILIDIKPGSYPNSINNDGNGVIPVAIFTTDTFDAATVDPATVTLDGAAARVKGKSGNVGSLQDVDDDGDLDLVIQIEDTDGTYELGDTVAILHALTYDDFDIYGQDTIRVVPPG